MTFPRTQRLADITTENRGATEVGRSSSLQRNMELLANQIDQLDQVISELAGRLSPVLIARPGDDNEGPHYPADSMLSSDVARFIHLVNSQIDRLRIMLDSIDL